MDEYRDQTPDGQNDHNPIAPSGSPYGDNQNNDQQRPLPTSQNDQSYWQNSPHNDQQYWQNGPQNGQQQWQNGSQNGQQQWQNNQPNGQPYWQNNQQNNQPYWQNNPQNGMPYGQPPKQRNNMALASMIFGILALLACCIPFIQFPLAVVAIVLVILSKKKRPLSGFAIAGLVMGIIAIIISILMTIYWGALISMMNDPEFMDIYNELLKTYQQ